MNAPSTPSFDLAHRVERVTNISPASDAFVLFTLATLFFTIGCFALWMWTIWWRGEKRRRGRQSDSSADQAGPEPMARLPDHSRAEDETPGAPWEKPADWWKR